MGAIALCDFIFSRVLVYVCFLYFRALLEMANFVENTVVMNLYSLIIQLIGDIVFGS